VFGQAAISQALLSDVRSLKKTLSELAVGHTWQSAGMLPGLYVLAVGSETVAITATRQPDQLCKLVSQAVSTGPTIQCHLVQVDAPSWERYLGGEDTACIECETNGCRPLMACVCDLQDNPQCPRSKTGISRISDVMQRQMDAPLANGAKVDLGQLPLFTKVLRQVIHYEFSLWCTGKQGHEPTGESVYSTLTAHCGVAWVQLYCGRDFNLTSKLFERELVHWLQDRIEGERSGKQRKGLVARLHSTWPKKSAPVFFIGQHVYARWTNDVGKLVADVNRTVSDKRGFEGTIAAEGAAAGFWRVGFDGEPDHPGIPAKYITGREPEGEGEGEAEGL
jgi:hypothetical protein